VLTATSVRLAVSTASTTAASTSASAYFVARNIRIMQH